MPLSKDQIEIIITDDAETMHLLLSLFYPLVAEIPEDFSLAKLVHFYRISLKYTFEVAIARLTGFLITRVNNNPSEALILFAVGSVLDRSEISRAASMASLKCGTLELIGSYSLEDSRFFAKLNNGWARLKAFESPSGGS
jgi:hypothetical protein